MIRLFVLVLLLVPVSGFAYEAIEVVQPSAFEISTVKEVSAEQWFVGELDNFPHTFEFLLTEPTSLRVQVMQLAGEAEPNCLSLIAIREVTRGVEEVMRRSCEDATWEPFSDPVSKLDFVENQYYEDKLEAGIYRVEVSSPDNQGRYVLKWGTENTASGYFATLKSINTLRSGLGLSPVGILGSKYVFVPLFVIFSLGFFGWYWHRKQTDRLTG